MVCQFVRHWSLPSTAHTVKIQIRWKMPLKMSEVFRHLKSDRITNMPTIGNMNIENTAQRVQTLNAHNHDLQQWEMYKLWFPYNAFVFFSFHFFFGERPKRLVHYRKYTYQTLRIGRWSRSNQTHTQKLSNDRSSIWNSHCCISMRCVMPWTIFGHLRYSLHKNFKYFCCPFFFVFTYIKSFLILCLLYS